jgi:hypothetical protein
MLKTISAALLAVTVLVAPALAASPAAKTAHPPVTKSVQLKPSVLNANARMGHHHWHHRHHRHFRHYRHYRHHRFHRR